MATLDAEQFARNMASIGEVFRDLERTILFGWPHNYYPNDEQAKMIVAVHGELSLQNYTEGLQDYQRWYLAGQIVARIERDVK